MKTTKTNDGTGISDLSKTIEIIKNLLGESGFNCDGEIELPEKKPNLCPIPGNLNSKVYGFLKEAFPDGLYTHQAEAISASLAGHDICLATSTASGKSLPFMAIAVHEIIKDPQARVLVLYLVSS